MICECARVLLVEGDEKLADRLSSTLASDGHYVEMVSTAEAAKNSLSTREFDLIISDVTLPRGTGIGLARDVRAKDPDEPIILITGATALDHVVEAIEVGAFKLLLKPVDLMALKQAVRDGLRARRRALRRRRVLEAHPVPTTGEISIVEVALGSLWMAYQPIVRWSDRSVIGREAFVRAGAASFDTAAALVETARRTDRLATLGRAVRAAVAKGAESLRDGELLFINVHVQDLMDDTLLGEDEPLARFAPRLVLEISEHAPVDGAADLGERLAALRRRGVRLALDDLGAGHSGLSNLALLRPEIVKLDMGLTRGVERDSRKRELVRSMVSFCRRTSTRLIVEGVETEAERDLLLELGCDLFQGHLFGRPVRDVAFEPEW